MAPHTLPTRTQHRRISRALLCAVGLCVIATLAACSGTPDKPDGPITDGPQNVVDEKAVEHFEAAVQLYEKSPRGSRPYSEIEAKLRKALDIDENFSRAWFNLGVIYHEQGKLDEAIDFYQKSSASDETNASPLVNTGMIRWSRGEKDEAFDLFVRAAEVEPFNPAARNNLAVIFRMRKDYPKAVENVRRALAGNSQSLAAYNNLARIYFDLEKYELARLVCINAFEISPEDNPEAAAPIHNTMGLILLKLNNVTVALQEFNKAVQLDANLAEAHMNIGAIALNIRDYDRAITHFTKVTQLRDNDTEALLSLAVAKRGKGDLDGAMAGYKQVLSLDEGNSWAHWNIAVMNHEIYAQEAENPVKAIEFYQKAIEHYREFLRLDTASAPEVRQDADKRISNCTQLIKTQEQLKDMLKQQEQMEKEAAAAEEAEKKAAEEENNEATPADGGNP